MSAFAISGMSDGDDSAYSTNSVAARTARRAAPLALSLPISSTRAAQSSDSGITPPGFIEEETRREVKSKRTIAALGGAVSGARLCSDGLSRFGHSVAPVPGVSRVRAALAGAPPVLLAQAANRSGRPAGQVALLPAGARRPTGDGARRPGHLAARRVCARGLRVRRAR